MAYLFAFFIVLAAWPTTTVCASCIESNWQQEFVRKIEQAAFPDWMMEQIQEDLMPFRGKKIGLEEIQSLIAENPGSSFLVCSIKDGKVYWTSHLVGTSQDFRAERWIRGMNQLAQCICLPDVTCLIYIGEAFCGESPVPVFSWCKHSEWSPATVSIPDDEAFCGNEAFLREVETGISRYPWRRKRNQAFWRGISVGGWGFEFMPRMKLAELSVEYPSLIDAKFTMIIQKEHVNSKKLAKLLSYFGSEVPVSEHLQRKYQLLPDGFVSSFSRGYWEMFSQCAIFKQRSPWSQWFYRALQPYEHYIPYEADGSDLVEKLEWAMQNDDVVRMIARQANDFAHNNLKRSDVMLYVYLLLSEYAQMEKKFL